MKYYGLDYGEERWHGYSYHRQYGWFPEHTKLISHRFKNRGDYGKIRQDKMSNFQERGSFTRPTFS